MTNETRIHDPGVPELVAGAGGRSGAPKRLRRAGIATAGRRAAAIQPGACFGLVEITELSNNRAFLISLK